MLDCREGKKRLDGLACREAAVDLADARAKLSEQTAKLQQNLELIGLADDLIQVCSP
jgi:hypothetical protein